MRLIDNRVFAASVGKQIEAIDLRNDMLHVKFTDGTAIQIADEGQMCCETRYMRTDDDLFTFVGAVLVGGEIRSAPDVPSEEDHEVQFLFCIRTKVTSFCRPTTSTTGTTAGSKSR